MCIASLMSTLTDDWNEMKKLSGASFRLKDNPCNPSCQPRVFLCCTSSIISQLAENRLHIIWLHSVRRPGRMHLAAPQPCGLWDYEQTTTYRRNRVRVRAPLIFFFDIVAGNKRQCRAWVRQGKLFRKVQHNAMRCRLRFLGWICQIYSYPCQLLLCISSSTHHSMRRVGKKKDRLLGYNGGRGMYQNGGLGEHSLSLSLRNGTARGWGESSESIFGPFNLSIASCCVKMYHDCAAGVSLFVARERSIRRWS